MTTTTFILGSSSSSSSAGSTPLAPSPALNLLPFSLGSTSKPYASTAAPLSSYFQPRPAAANTPGVAAGTPIAAFRGRALVGQAIEVPRGYRGIVLSTTARPDHGGVEERRTVTNGADAGRALTPASTAPSVAGESEVGDGRRVTRNAAAAVKGAGQVALSRPKRQAPRRANTKKRVRLDSDDEEEQEIAVKAEQDEPASTPKKGASGGLGRTPSKRLRSAEVPVIRVQQPTPRKGPALAATSTEVSIVEVEEELAPGEDGMDETSVEGEDGPSERTGKTETRENIVPSPATEDDPPAFPITLQPSIEQIAVEVVKKETGEVMDERDREGNADNDRAVRILRPTSTFKSFTLWTADAPLAGFRPDELRAKAAAAALVHKEPESIRPDPADTDSTAPIEGQADEADRAGHSLQPGWWRVGGAGEGGDEFVRAMGEWLGLVEMLNEPVYLKGVEDDHESDEEDDD